jgi:hypothetical protein
MYFRPKPIKNYLTCSAVGGLLAGTSEGIDAMPEGCETYYEYWLGQQCFVVAFLDTLLSAFSGDGVFTHKSKCFCV